MSSLPEKNEIASQLRVGVTRVRDVDGFVGTVMYVGLVPSASAKSSSEIYAGIEWDDVSRGKHNGSVICRKTNQLVRVFHCSDHSGSFLRLSKLDLGATLTQALCKTRYVDMDAPMVAPNNILPHSAKTSGGRDKPIEFLGELKIRKRQQLSDLDKISLRSLGIARASSDAQAMKEFQHIKDIDLAGNLLCDWNTVFAILDQFPLLEYVSLASNRILDIPQSLSLSTNTRSSLDKIRVLNLKACSIKSIRTIQWIADSIPHLQELCVAYNDLSDVKDNVQGFDNLTFLDCSSCGFTSWRGQIHCFGKLPRLEQFMLNDNDISNISVEAVDPDSFTSLRSLQLAGTSISSWRDLDGIRLLRSLAVLRFRNTPLTRSMGAGEARSITIARLPNITELNASPISSKERVEAERRYVASVAREVLVANDEDGKNAVLALHPLFPDLVELHKDSMTSCALGNGGVSTATQAVNVIVISMAADSCSMEPLRKRLPGGLKVGRLKAMCMRAFGLEMERQMLHAKREVND